MSPVEMEGVLEMNEMFPVQLVEVDGIAYVQALTDAGFNATMVPLRPLVLWLRTNRPDLLDNTKALTGRA